MTALQFLKRLWRRKANPIQLLKQLVPTEVSLTTLIHVGAHLGQERQLYESHGFREILWIEGSPTVHARLAASMQEHMNSSVYCRTGVRHQTACAVLTDRNGDEVELREFSNDGASSSIFPSTAECQQRWPGLMETGRTERVVTRTLDDLAHERGMLESCDVLVVDVQGAELLVLKGAEQTLAHAKAVVTEASTVPFYAGGVLYPELQSFLVARGFQPMSLPSRHGDILFLCNDLAETYA